MFPVHKINVVDEPGPSYGSMEYDNLNYDEEVNRLLDEVEEEFLGDYKTKNDDISNDTRDFLRNELENYDFPEDTHHVGSIPDWYRNMLKNKIKKAKSRLENLSKLVCATSPSTAAHIKRIEADHSTAFCKMDYPKHPPMHKSWRSTWEFCYRKKCENTDSNHTHKATCLVVVDYKTGRRMDTPNISQQDYPLHVIHVARFLRNFAEKVNKRLSLSKGKKKSVGQENVDEIEDDWWTDMTMVLINNHLNELMIVFRRDRVTVLTPHLKMYFPPVIGQYPNIVSVLAFHTGKARSTSRRKLLKAKNNIDKNREELLILGTTVLKDKIGPLSVQYELGNHQLHFDSVETMQLGKVIQDYMCLTRETTLLDIGCDLGLLSLIMAHKCEKVIRFTAGPDVTRLNNEAEKLKIANKIHNVSFFLLNTKNIIIKCAPLIEQCITVAIVKLKSAKPILGERLKVVMKILRNLPSIWRIIIYGSFTNNFHESIEVLMSEDDSLGERFLPIQGCIVDKSPTVVDAFDLVILFERKSIIAPKVELFAPGPTVNVADSLDAEEMKSELLLDGDQEIENLNEIPEKIVPMPTVTEKKSQSSARKEFQRISSPPPTKTLRNRKPKQPKNGQLLPTPSEKMKFQFDRPPLLSGIFPPFSYPSSSVNEEFHFNFPPHPFQTFPHFHPNPSGPMRNDFQHDYPPLPLKSRFPNPNFYPEPYPPMRERYFSAPIIQGPYLPNAGIYFNPYHHAIVSNEFQNHYQSPPPPPPVLPVPPINQKALKKKMLIFYPPPPPVRYPSPPPPPPLPPPEEVDLLDEDSNVSSSSTIVTDEPMQLCEEEEEEEDVGETVNVAEDVISSVVIKSEPIDTSYCIDVSEAYCHSPTTTVNDKLIQACEEKVSKVINTVGDVISSVSIKSEPVDPSYSADLSDDDGTFLEGNRYSPTISVKSEPLLQNEEKKESNVQDCVSSVKAEPLQNEDQKESNAVDFGTNVKAEPLQDKEKIESNAEDCRSSVKAEPLQDEEKNDSKIADSKTSATICIKSEPMDQSSSVNFSEGSCQNTILPVTTKSEPAAFSPIASPDCEPMDMQISPSIPDFQSLETPIHNPRALSDITPVTVSKNVSVSGSDFPVQTNQSFLSNDKPKVVVNIDKEPGEISDSDEENEKINEEKNKQKKKSQSIGVPKKHVSTTPVQSRKLVRPPRPFPGKYSESSSSRDRGHRRRSPSPKRVKRSSTPENRRRRRSPVSDRRRERSKRSPLRRAHGRARSPRDRRTRRSRSRSPRRR